jgi:hypothetical protein
MVGATAGGASQIEHRFHLGWIGDAIAGQYGAQIGDINAHLAHFDTHHLGG